MYFIYHKTYTNLLLTSLVEIINFYEEDGYRGNLKKNPAFEKSDRNGLIYNNFVREDKNYYTYFWNYKQINI